MAAIDDEVLAYAMVMGHSYTLNETLSAKGKKVKRRGLQLSVTGGPVEGCKSNSSPYAHFIARLMSDRTVSVTQDIYRVLKPFEWVITDGRTGLQLRFEAPSEESVRALMAGASTIKVDAELGVFEAALERVREFRRLESIAVAKERAAEKKWPPTEGSQTARILALARASTSLRYTRSVSRSYGWTEFKTTSATALIAKLKDRNLAVASFAIHDHDSPAGKEESLPAGYAYVVVTFCAIDDPRKNEVSKYEFIANVEEAAMPMNKPAAPEREIGLKA